MEVPVLKLSKLDQQTGQDIPASISYKKVSTKELYADYAGKH